MKTTATVYQSVAPSEAYKKLHFEKLPDRTFSNRYHYKAKVVKDQFKKVIDRSRKVLLKITTVFPVHFFPTIITIDEAKINIIRKEFFGCESVRSIPIKNIQYISAEVGLLFGTLRIKAFGYADTEFYINYLWASDALKARRIIEGLIVCIEDNIDCSGYEINALKKLVELIGEEHQ